MDTIEEIIKKSEYGFLNEDVHLKGKLAFLVFGGSRAYGTSTASSDTDIRGCAFGGKAAANSGLPERPDSRRIEVFVMSVNERIVAGEY